MGDLWLPPDDVTVDAPPPWRVDTLRRSPFALVKAIEQFKVELAPRYNADVTGPAGVPDGRAEPWCNLFVYDWLESMCITLPRVEGQRMRANAMVRYLSGSTEGWSVAQQSVASQLAARLGWPVVVGWRNPDATRSGHVAALRPPPPGQDESLLWVAQAGRVRSSCIPLRQAFRGLPVTFFVHE